MRTIWKYKIDGNNIEVPYGSKILSVANQNDVPVVWFDVDDDMIQMETWVICIVVTGGNIPTNNRAEFIGTILLHNGSDVLHIYAWRK